MITEAEFIFTELDKLNIFNVLSELREMTTKLKEAGNSFDILQIIHSYAHLFETNSASINGAT